MRKIYLEIDGVRTGLNNEDGLFLTDVAGFGAKFNNQYSEISDGFYYNANNKQSQGSVVGTLNIMSNAYTKYKTFADSIMTASKLVLVYDPLGNGTEYKADCHISYMTKSESVCGVYMAVPIAFVLDGLWYQDTAVTTANMWFDVTQGGHIPSCVVASHLFYGAYANPTITITDSNSIVVAECVLAITTQNRDVLEFSNLYDDCHVTLTRSGAVYDYIEYADLTKSIFGRAKTNYRYRLTTDEGVHAARVTATVRKYWRTV